MPSTFALTTAVAQMAFSRRKQTFEAPYSQVFAGVSFSQPVVDVVSPSPPRDWQKAVFSWVTISFSWNLPHVFVKSVTSGEAALRKLQ